MLYVIINPIVSLKKRKRKSMNKIISFFSRMLIATFVFMVDIAMLLVDFILLPFKYLSRMPVGMKVAVILLLSVVCQSVSLYAQDGGGGEQDVKKKIMMTVGACIFMIAAAQCLPLFFAN